MRHGLLGLAVWGLVSGVAAAQTPYGAYEQKTVSTSVVTLTSATINQGAGHPQANQATCRVQSAGLRFRVDGTDPSSTVGFPLSAGDAVFLAGNETLNAFEAIRSGGTDAVLECVYTSTVAQPNTPAVVVVPASTIDNSTTLSNMETLLDSIDATLTTINTNLSVDATHDSAVRSNGPQIQLEAHSDISGTTAVADGDAVRAAADVSGRAVAVGPCDRSARIGGVTTITDGSSTAATGMGAGGASVYNELWDVTIANTSASAVTLDLRDGTGGSVLWTFPIPANTSGMTHTFTVPRTSTANTAFAWDPSAAASSIIISASGCKVK